MTVLLKGVMSPLLFGYCVLWLLAPRIGLLPRISFGVGIGAGLLSCCFFVSLVTGLRSVYVEVVALIVAIAALFTAFFGMRSFD